VEARLNSKNGELNSQFVGRAQGSTKKTAEQDAARQLLAHLAGGTRPAGAKSARVLLPVEK
ncbi:MAG: putative dsRNA-binding protein, partial [Candidatus Sulfotelmatobacter sp.]